MHNIYIVQFKLNTLNDVVKKHMKNETNAEFVEKMGLISQRDGLPRIAGRILGLLVIEGGEFSFNDLSEILQISRASVSTNTRLLENLSIIERKAKAGERQDFFSLKKQPYKALMRSMRVNMQNALGTVEDTIQEVEDNDAKERLSELSQFYTSFLTVTEKLSEE